MRFRPPGGPQVPKPDKLAQDARAAIVGETISDEPVFQRHRSETDIERAENIAAGLPPGGPTEGDGQDADAPATVLPPDDEQPFVPVPVADPKPRNLLESIKQTAEKVIRKVQRFIKPPEKRIHKEVVIHCKWPNSETVNWNVALPRSRAYCWPRINFRRKLESPQGLCVLP